MQIEDSLYQKKLLEPLAEAKPTSMKALLLLFGHELLQQLMRTDTGAEGTIKGRKQNRNKSKSWKIGEIKYRDKKVNMAAGDFGDALVCCVENTVKDRIMDYGASFHATYCIEEIGINMLALKGNVPDVHKVDIYFFKLCGLRKQKKLSFIMSEYTRKLLRLEQTAAGVAVETPLQFGVAKRLSQTFRAKSMGLRAEARRCYGQIQLVQPT
ncbi:hypothetical protein Tco_0531086 [Tanacetum coccineum]